MISVIKNDEAAASLFKKASERLIFIQLRQSRPHVDELARDVLLHVPKSNGFDIYIYI